MNTATKVLLSQAKARLMETYHITEPEAHRFIIETSMNTGQTKEVIALKILEEVK
jgi:AmiR/NasT family two-component response regulator